MPWLDVPELLVGLCGKPSQSLFDQIEISPVWRRYRGHARQGGVQGRWQLTLYTIGGIHIGGGVLQRRWLVGLTNPISRLTAGRHSLPLISVHSRTWCRQIVAIKIDHIPYFHWNLLSYLADLDILSRNIFADSIGVV